ncbi:cold-shock protein [Pedobacter africanus]|jgi:CspA family cold shock protein|uniref:Cold shock protein (Beta-ribbon, CspA family) n=1 Tax=Pedobacter africanus TaxID=151894 RepID=A0A1W2EA70_9SPHI|nr:cold shock domain-containing protein [Pedobacter africanus]SMD06206.1 cold shock protein (beta-ribbon, CspA family) [Pedobacter africanus]
MPEGTVKFYQESKGFGFIVPANGEPEIFFHATALSEPVKQHDRVTYEVESGKKGLNAAKVRKL